MANKATNFIKQYFFMLALAATFVGFSAFKFIPSKSSTLWYDVTLNNPAFPNQLSNQIIDTNSGTATPPSDPCDKSSGIICSVELTLGATSSVPANMQQATDREGVDEGDVKIETTSLRTPLPH